MRSDIGTALRRFCGGIRHGLAVAGGGVLLTAAVCGAAALIGPGVAAASPTAAGSIGGSASGPAQLSVLGDPRLCWQGGGNGSPVLLERCDPALQEQQWTFTADGVVMDGSGYCLDGQAVPVEGGDALAVDFTDQCGGTPGQIWRFDGATGQVVDPRLGVCAAPNTGRPRVGAVLVRRPCGRSAGPRWSLGDSDVTVAAGRGRGVAGGPFVTGVSVSNAASAMTAYGVVVTFHADDGLTITGLRTVAGGGLTCRLATLSCSGELPAARVSRLQVTGRLTARVTRGSTRFVAVHVTVTGTNQSADAAPTTTEATVSVTAALATTPVATTGPPGNGPAAPLILAVGAAVLLSGGTLLLRLGRSRGGQRRDVAAGRRARHGPRPAGPR